MKTGARGVSRDVEGWAYDREHRGEVMSVDPRAEVIALLRSIDETLKALLALSQTKMAREGGPERQK